MFDFLKKSFTRIFGTAAVDQAALDDLEKTLIEADAGTTVSKKIVSDAQELWRHGKITSGLELKEHVKKTLMEGLAQTHKNTCADSLIIMLVGINGSGKTTAAAKLAYQAKKRGQKVLLVAADTFRAAAVEQLMIWAQKLDIPCMSGKENADPAAVAFTGVQKFYAEQFDMVIIDTAGRLQSKNNLMAECTKIQRSVTKAAGEQNTICTLLVLDSLLGQNSLEQARVFSEALKIDGIILTKMDGQTKGGIALAIAEQFKLPIVYTSHGETAESIQKFDPAAFINELLI